MAYAVFIREGEAPGLTKYERDGLPVLPGNVAVPLNKEQYQIARYMKKLGVYVFDQIAESIEFEGNHYTVTEDGKFEPPIEEKIYQRMKAKGLIE